MSQSIQWDYCIIGRLWERKGKHPSMVILWSKSFKACYKMVNRACSTGYTMDFHSNHIKAF